LNKVNVAYAFSYDNEKNMILMVNNLDLGWTLPGGTVEKNETIENAVIREVKEETGLDVEVEGVLATNEIFLEDEDLYILSGIPSLQGDEEILAVEWVTLETANKIKSKYPIYPGGISGLINSP
jgi:8-oxo-dGTP diphosphatase